MPRYPHLPGTVLPLVLLAVMSSAGTAQETYLIVGTDMGPRYNYVLVSNSSGPVSDAVVTVNGTPLTWNGSSYGVDLGFTIPAGDTITLVVEIGEDTVTGKDVVPEAPSVTGPSSGSEFTPSDPIPVTWTSTTDPDYFYVNVFCPDDCPQQNWVVPGDQRSFAIPAGTLDVNLETIIRVYAYNDGAFTGPADPESEMNVRAERGPFPTVIVLDLTPARESTWGLLKHRYR